MTHPPAPRFDPTINWGHILTATVILFGGIGVAVGGVIAFYALKGEVTAIDARVDARLTQVERSMQLMTTTLSKLVENTVIVAQQNERINALYARTENNERRIDRLEARPR